jgi:HEAT repeat protein/glucose/arabinose dehydrogenase
LPVSPVSHEKELAMRACFTSILIVLALSDSARSAQDPPARLPSVAAGWKIELAADARQVLFPTAIAAAPDGTLYVGSDPMDMPGPPTEAIDRVLAIKNGKAHAFAERLWCVKGLEWVDDTLFVVHAPFLSALRDRDGDGKADERVDLITGLGPKQPGFDGLNDYIASGIKLGMDGFLYVAVGHKGIPHGTGKDGRTISLSGGGVIRIRPDGTGLELVSTGECNPRSVALSATDEIFTYGTGDDSKKWQSSLTHHIVAGHYGYPYQFLTAPYRALPIMAGLKDGAGAQGICYNEDGLPAEDRGNLFFCDWGSQTVSRFEIKKAGGTFAVSRRSTLVSRGNCHDFRPFSLAAAADGASLWIVDWAYDGWSADGPRTGRLFRLSPSPDQQVTPAARPTGTDPVERIKSLDHPALSVRMESQRTLIRAGIAVVPLLVRRLNLAEPETGRLHALWALDALGGTEARKAIAAALHDPSPRVRLQAARSAGIRRDRDVVSELAQLLHDRDPAVRREAAIAFCGMGEGTPARELYKALDDSDAFAAWSIRQAIRRLGAWQKDELVSALLDERRREPALRLADESWSIIVVTALSEAFTHSLSAPVRGRILADIAGLLHQYPDWNGTWFGTNPLAAGFPRKTKNWDENAMKAVLDGLSLGLTDPDSLVRFQAITGIADAGNDAPPRLRSTLPLESDPTNQAVIVETLAALKDAVSVPLFVEILADSRREERVRMAALAALGRFRDPQSLRARLSLIYQDKVPPSLVAAALPDLARTGLLPPNDLGSFIENPAPEVRASALLSLNVKKTLPDDLRQSVLDHISDPSETVRQAAILAVPPLQLHAAVPRLLELAARPGSPDYATAVEALCTLHDPRALPVYLTALDESDPRLRKLAESALLAIRDKVHAELVAAVKSRRLGPTASLSLDRILARFTPITNWRVIGPFPRNAPGLGSGSAPIDFSKSYFGSGGNPVSWTDRHADPASGRIDLDNFIQAAIGTGTTGNDPGVSSSLAAFAYAEANVDRACPALLIANSSGALVVTINEKPVYPLAGADDHSGGPAQDVVRFNLTRGRNRILLFCRKGTGPWFYSLQIAPLATTENPAVAATPKK